MPHDAATPLPFHLRPSVTWTAAAVEIIDQTALPTVERVLRLDTVELVVGAIRRLAVRGAPAIGLCGAFGTVVAIDALPDRELTAGELVEAAAPIAAARPTAVNLRWAVERVLGAAGTGSRAAVRERALAEALAIEAEDRAACEAIGEHGRSALADAVGILTICNTGRLIAAGSGTALGIVYAKARAGEPVEVFACETRPLLQGSRLTAWELHAAGIPVTVLTEGAASTLLAQGRVDAVIAGADRIAANGDAANKIGTYALAVAARHHRVPFYVAAPRSTLDAATPAGAAIRIEERDGDEIRVAAGLPPEVAVWNPAFDVTPAELIDGIVTEVGILRAPYQHAIARALAADAVAVP